MNNMLLTPNKYSRPQKELKQIKGIVVHWVANPNSTALANRNYFESRKHGKNGYGSAHEIIGLDGNIIIAIPENEMAYHVGSKTYTAAALERLSDYPNDCTYGIECTHINWDGKMTDQTMESLISRCTELCKKFNLTSQDLWLHQEVVGWKDCHRWFVNNPQEWEKFKNEVQRRLEQQHWAAPIRQKLKDMGIELDERYDDKMTRAEGMALALKILEKILGGM